MLAKGTKVTGRGEGMSAHYAFGPKEDDAIIKPRLLSRTTTTRGEPPLKKLQKKFMSFATEIEKDADNVDELQISIEDEQRSMADELRAATEDQNMSIEEGSGCDSDAMAVD